VYGGDAPQATTAGDADGRKALIEAMRIDHPFAKGMSAVGVRKSSIAQIQSSLDNQPPLVTERVGLLMVSTRTFGCRRRTPFTQRQSVWRFSASAVTQHEA
jgi:hypothetical protein